MPPGIRMRLTLILRVIEAAAETADPNATFERLLDLLDAISRRGSYWRCCSSIRNQCTRSPSWSARRPGPPSSSTATRSLLDEAIDPRMLENTSTCPPSAPTARQLDELEPTWNARWT